MSLFGAALERHRAGDLDGAERGYRAALAEQPGHDRTWGNLGLVLAQQPGAEAEAEAALRQATALKPQDASHHYNLGNFLWRRGRLQEAHAAYETSLSLRPDDPDCRLNLGNVKLCLGDDFGWSLYASRPERRNALSHKLGFPEWAGEALEGKRLFIWSEQGLGDQLFAARYVRNLKAAEVTLVCAATLAPLFTQLPAVVVPRIEVVPVGMHDFWTQPLSIPQWVAPGPTPYLTARASTSPHGRIGLMWRGNVRPDPGRSLTPALAERLLALPGVFSLQPEDTGARDMAETAEILMGLERVITIDTSVAHLAGALGKPATVLLTHYPSDWRWREQAPGRSYWHPSLELRRQPAPSRWEPVVEQLAAELSRTSSSAPPDAAAP
jgi:hypothetical protein